MAHYNNFSLQDIVEYVDGIGWVTEHWEWVKGYEDLYKVSNFGRIKSYPRNGTAKGEKIIKQCLDWYGYLTVALHKKDVQKTKTVHRLVAIVFIENKNGLPQVDHKWGDKKDNRASELQWVTGSQNKKNAYAIGITSQLGEKNNVTNLDNETVLNIFNEKGKQTDIAIKYSTTRAIVQCIKNGKSWTHITGKVYEKALRAITEKDVIEIFNSKEDKHFLAKLYSISERYVRQIRNGERHSLVTGKVFVRV